MQVQSYLLFFVKLIFVKDQNSVPQVALDDGGKGTDLLLTNNFIFKKKVMILIAFLGCISTDLFGYFLLHLIVTNNS